MNHHVKDPSSRKRHTGKNKYYWWHWSIGYWSEKLDCKIESFPAVIFPVKVDIPRKFYDEPLSIYLSLLKRLFSELFFSDASLWNQYKFIVFNILSCGILIISCKIWVMTVISNKKPIELTIYVKLCRSVTIFNRQELAFVFQIQEKLRAVEFKIKVFSSNYFIANDSHMKIIYSYTVVFNVQVVFYFWDNFHLLKHYPKKVPKNCLCIQLLK